MKSILQNFRPYFFRDGLAIALLFGAVSCGAQGSSSVDDARCATIANVKIAGVTITQAESIPAGLFIAPGHHAPTKLPAFCRVALTAQPAADSNIKIELWMPENNWNGRFLGTGNGGGAGSISYGALGSGLDRDYATANTDLGTSPKADAVIDHPERWADFGYRATHVMTVVSKTIIASYYNRPQRKSYFFGCSTGGQQGLMEAQRYPLDYDGIVAGAPANNRTHLHVEFLWNLRAASRAAGSLLPPEKVALLTKAVVAACAGKDGGSPQDDFLTDPRECRFDPRTIPKCKGTDTSACLTELQLRAIQQIYAGPTDPKTGERIYTPIPFGSENSSAGLNYQQDVAGIVKDFYPFRWAFGADFEFHDFDFDRDLSAMDAKLSPVLNANNPDLSGMKRNGGKIVMYTGTADPLVPFQDALNYYERVDEHQEQMGFAKNKKVSGESGKETEDFFRYFLVPGMAHCGGGPGLNDIGQMISPDVPRDSEHDVLAATVRWVEQGIAPDTIIATSFTDRDPAKGIRFQRPICPYPKFPDFIGGDWKSPGSYRCVAHPRHRVAAPAERYLH